MRVLVLGGGFLGSATAFACARAGHRIRLFTRSPPAERSRLRDADVRIGDVCDLDAVTSALPEVDAVVYAVPPFPLGTAPATIETFRSGILAALQRMLESPAFARVRQLLFFSSGGAVYGDASRLPVPEDHPLRPKSLYGEANVLVESVLRGHATEHPLEVKVLRVGNAYGRGQRSTGAQGIVAVALACLASGQAFRLFGDGSTIRDYVEIDDVTAAVVAALETPGSVTVNIGSGVGVRTDELLATIERVADETLLIERCAARDQDVSRSVLDVRLARERLGWSARIPLAEGLQRLMHPSP